MQPSDVSDLIVAILNKSEKGQINWVPASEVGMGGEENDFVANFPEYSINIWTNSDDDLLFSIINSRGKQVFVQGYSDPNPMTSTVRRLFNAAKFKAMDLDGAVGYLKGIMDSDGVIGDPKHKPGPPEKKPSFSDDDIPF